ncbi:hypothetical protein DICPUDRAFT_57015 [Dictyostelium purpureum]|uniref:AB hydrolase-1 domain-containing protein n=1 Tax=Dictyostelium purpureum TaxID=5786 RepID=F0ZTW9_DICPU|nr:uncharacterized protein DICPUDRAFT_57015 [Dictyostelium purpureum]EGC32606.1 hypothetical protein DICPUDRAFT_57015 [Dictyostelium purpureum]|eukprot:XP_003290858.1 hypothetical protein DICPUDRAFT_57015 [Dictyostelium purpureum]
MSSLKNSLNNSIGNSSEPINVVVHSDNSDPSETRFEIPTKHGKLVCFQRKGLNESPNMPTIISYHDLGLNHSTCFSPFFNHPNMKNILPYLNIIHIDAPGHEFNSESIPSSQYPTIYEMAEDIQYVVDYFKIKMFIGLGAGAGGCVLTQYATLFPKTIMGLILVGSVIKSFSWLDWVKSWVELTTLPSLKNPTGVRNYLINHYYADNLEETNPDLLENIKREMLLINPDNLYHYVHSFVKREDIKEDQIKALSCKVLLVVGKDSSYREDIIDLFSHFNPRNSTILQVQDCGILVTAEKPGDIIEPFKLFMQGIGYLLDYYQNIDQSQK